MTTIQGEASEACGVLGGEPEHRAGSGSLSDNVSSLTHGVWQGNPPQPRGRFGLRGKDNMFLVQFHTLVEMHFQGRALSFIRFCTSIPCQQLEPFWIYMLDAAALLGLPGLNFVTGEKAKSLFTRLNGKV